MRGEEAMLTGLLASLRGGREHSDSQDQAARLFVNGFVDPVSFLERQAAVLKHPAVLKVWQAILAITDAEHLAASDERKNCPQHVFDQIIGMAKDLELDIEKAKADEVYGASFYPEIGILNQIRESMLQTCMSKQHLAENARRKVEEEAKVAAPTN